MRSLRLLRQIPEGLLDCDAREIGRTLTGPTLIDLPGEAGAPLFVSVLLHGNETTGLAAMQAVLADFLERPAPRPLMVFIGNVEAAAAGVRMLPGQYDYNRVWPGTTLGDAPEADLMQAVFDHVAARGPFASIDIHNTTGRHPHYACVNRLDERWFHLARLFSRTVVYFTEPTGVQSAALATVCPAITIECGRVDSDSAAAHAAGLITAVLHLPDFPTEPVPAHELDLLRTTHVVKVPAPSSFSFDGAPADFRFRDDLETLNFRELPRGTVLGELGDGTRDRLHVQATSDLAEPSILDYDDGRIRLAAEKVPAMLNHDERAVRHDCLCYLMERIDRNGEPLRAGEE